MIHPDAIEAIRRGRFGVHISWGGGIYEAKNVCNINLDLFIETTHLNGDPGPTIRASEALALERTYEGEGG